MEENQSVTQNQNTSKKTILKLSIIFVFFIFLSGIIGFTLGGKNTQIKLKQTSIAPKLLISTTPIMAQKDINATNSIPYWSDPNGFFHIYSSCDNSSNCDVFVTTRQSNSQIIKALSLKDFHGEFGQVFWSNGQSNTYDKKFILQVTGPGDGTGYYLLFVDGRPAIKLNLASGILGGDRVISWIDDKKILLQHVDNTTPSNSKPTYEVSSIDNLSKRQKIAL